MPKMKGSVSNGLEFEIKDNGVILCGIGSCSDTYITVPALVKSLPVVAVAPRAFANCSEITDVILPSTVKTVGKEAFAWCRSLTMAKLLGIIEIEPRAFMGCDHLAELDLSYYLISIGEKAFAYCSSLTSVKLPDTLIELRVSAFESCRSLRAITIPRKIKQIENGTFSACMSLRKVILQETLEYIDEYAFAYCENLITPNIPLKTVVNRDAFFECPVNDFRKRVS